MTNRSLPEKIEGCAPRFWKNTQLLLAQKARYLAHVQSFSAGTPSRVHTFRHPPGTRPIRSPLSGYDTYRHRCRNPTERDARGACRQLKYLHCSVMGARFARMACSAPQQNTVTTGQGPNTTAVHGARNPRACSQSQRETEVRQKKRSASLGMP